MKWDIWMEGFQLSHDDVTTPASYIGNADAPTFQDAVWKWFCKNPSNSFDEITMTFWGCRLFPTETEARKSFG